MTEGYVIDAYFDILDESILNEDVKNYWRCLFMKHFVQRLTMQKEEKDRLGFMSRFMPECKDDINSEADKYIFVLNNDLHWHLVVLDFCEEGFFAYNSLPYIRYKKQVFDWVECIKKFFHENITVVDISKWKIN
ncbi:hypothetical protein QJS04_geneDACA000977 [Acorus gramineus]|uniref:Ubiquitin-like protease family profile domain-containing protein n=1 Tax=Acorus gramineus TaxID=55184 RepID=A0AAV9AB69_ACOGR|nr:hypothetical protein QJS04_geneDACA000977 [Acorus gramineus]